MNGVEALLERHRERLDAINVFPVPDGDTGTNLHLTAREAARGAWEAFDDGADDVGSILHAAAESALDNARGNSGTILSVFLIGFAEPLAAASRLNLPRFAEALERGQLRAWSALTDPVPGTMPTAMSAAARAAADALHDDEVTGGEPESRAALLAGLERAVTAARAAVVRSESELETLTAARVVDAGAVGFLLVLEALRAALTGEEVPDGVLAEFGTHQPAAAHHQVPGEIQDGVEVMCSMDLDPLGAATLRGELAGLGDSVVMSPLPRPGSGDAEDLDREAESQEAVRWRIHVHVPAADPVLQLLNGYGSPDNVTITSLSSAEPCR
nr:DAK2 domain-containing protein [Zhihengliuella flava]